MSFRSARKTAGYTIRAAAEKLGVSHNAVFLWEKGEAWPQSKRMPEIAKLYGCTIEKLLENNDRGAN